MAQSTARKFVKKTENEQQQAKNTQSPLERQKLKYKRRERTALCVSLGWAAILGCLTISSATNLNTAQSNFQNITGEITTLSSKNSNIKQEVSELSSRTRLTDIAKKDGLVLNEQNTRNVTK